MYVEGCRCGVARELALPGVEIGPRAAEGPGALTRVAGALLGYAPGAGWTGGRRAAAGAAFVVKLGVTFALVYAVTSGEASVSDGDVRIVARLDEHTARQSASVKDTIPTFLLRPGLLGTLPAPPAPETPVTTPAVPASKTSAPVVPAAPIDTIAELVPLSTITPLADAELRKGFCTPTLTGLVRQRFPGSYDTMSDAELEKRVLAKYPEYRGRICDLPAWIGAGPHEIVKDEPVGRRAALMPLLPPWALAGLVTLGLAFVSLNVDYRVLARRLATS